MGVVETVWEKGEGNHLSGSEERWKERRLYMRSAGVRRGEE